jgi:hypothetical protein
VDDSLPTGTLPAALKAGKVTSVVLGLENAISARQQDSELELGLFLGPPRSLAYGVRREDKVLLKSLDEYIGHFRRSASWSQLVVKYFGEQALEVLKKGADRGPVSSIHNHDQ